jgi:hypothetical protein
MDDKINHNDKIRQTCFQKLGREFCVKNDFELALSLVYPGERLLELDCGLGRLTAFLSMFGYVDRIIFKKGTFNLLERNSSSAKAKWRCLSSFD